jgi:L-lactate dehydrogenase complex protein LldF
MNQIQHKFLTDAEKRAFDPEHRQRLKFRIEKYNEQVQSGLKKFQNLELAKRRAANIKHKAINNLERYLVEFDNNFSKRGGKVIWAPSEKEVIKEILYIIRKEKVQVVIRQKAMLDEDPELNEMLEKNKREVFETDLGEYIVQMDGEKPSAVRDSFNRADMAITGANFLVADSGAVVLTENEGNGLFTVAFPRIHVVIAGIENLIPKLEDLGLLLPLFAYHATGQNITAYNNLLFGPKTDSEPDGPDKMYVILLDNRRTELLKFREQRKALSCIRCGACLNGCPIYRSVGGKTYGAKYSGPIGSVVAPHYLGFREYNHLSFASTLCGKCTDICPVRIPLHELLLYNRQEAVRRKDVPMTWRNLIGGWKMVMMHRWMLDKPKAGMKNRVVAYFGKKMWGKRRSFPKVTQKSFKEQWSEKNPQ